MVKPLKVGVLLSRIPIITPQPSPFMQAYYKYMSGLEKRLMWTFPSYVYFKKGSLAERSFLDNQPSSPAPQKNLVFPKGTPLMQHNRDLNSKQDIRLVVDEEEKVTRQPRQTEADAKNDFKSLERKIDQTLYLLVKQGSGKWRLPAFDVPNDAPSLHEAAESGLAAIGGTDMNIWTVSRTPAGVIEHSSEKPEFVLRQHILQGLFKPAKNVDYAWLERSEIENKVDTEYYKQIEHLI